MTSILLPKPMSHQQLQIIDFFVITNETKIRLRVVLLRLQILLKMRTFAAEFKIIDIRQ